MTEAIPVSTEPGTQVLPPAEPAPIATLPPAPGSETGTVQVMRMIERLNDAPSFDKERILFLIEIKERWEQDEGRKAYYAAMARFQANLPRVKKNVHVHFESRDRNKDDTDFWHADLAAYLNAAAPLLGAQGLFYDHDVEQTDDGLIHVTCMLGHALGHSKTVTMKAPPDDTGNKTLVQQIKSTNTRLRRATFEAITGLAAEGDDNENEDRAPVALISTEQLAKLNAEIAEVGADREAFLIYLGVERLADLPLPLLPKAVAALAAKRQGGAGAGPSPGPDPETGEVRE